MNELAIFENAEFGSIRTIEENGKILFCGKDIAEALGYDQPHKAIDRHCKSGMVRTVPHPQSLEKTIDMKFVTEGDLYRLIANSKLSTAEKFERWVFDEVLPTIRKTGSYSVNPSPLSKSEAEAKLNNSRARVSSLWMKLADKVNIPECKQICVCYASKALAGYEVIPLPEAAEHYYSATEIGFMLGATKQRIGKIANQHNLKTSEYGKLFLDKSPYSPKEVEAFRYNGKAVEQFKRLLEM